MSLAVVAMAFQLQATAAGSLETLTSTGRDVDSAGRLRRAREAQAWFERTRRSHLPWVESSGDRCEVRIGRFCWWYDDRAPVLPPEPSVVSARRDALISDLDSLATLHPGDDWLAGLRIHYRIDAGRHAEADSAARTCRATGWWCAALQGFAAHVRGDAGRADSSFAAALSRMDGPTRCQWTDIHTLLPSDTRDAYESMSCTARESLARRYWLLSRPRLSAPANEWRNEFYARRVQGWIASRTTTPHNMTWGADQEELLLRYGWPDTWGRVRPSGALSSAGEPGIIGHDPSPSFVFAPREALLDSLAIAGDAAWDLRSRLGESRYKPRDVRRIAEVAVQVARFRRDDGMLVAAAWTMRDDSVVAPLARLAASIDDSITIVSEPQPAQRGTSVVRLPGFARLVGIEITDSVSGTLARSRTAFAQERDGALMSLSDILFYRVGAEPASALDSALVHAIPGDTVGRDRPLGVFWETYGLPEVGDSANVAITVQRIDRSWFRSTRQALGIADVDSPLRIGWSDARGAGSPIAPHAISLDLANLPAGRYRVTVSVTPTNGPSALSAREFELRAP